MRSGVGHFHARLSAVEFPDDAADPRDGDDNEGPWKHAWTGDVWKIVPLLKAHRPDLDIKIFDCAPTGLVAVSNLDPGSTKLKDMYLSLVGELRALDLEKHTIERLWCEVPVVSSRSLVEFPEDLTLFVDARSRL